MPVNVMHCPVCMDYGLLVAFVTVNARSNAHDESGDMILFVTEIGCQFLGSLLLKTNNSKTIRSSADEINRSHVASMQENTGFNLVLSLSCKILLLFFVV